MFKTTKKGLFLKDGASGCSKSARSNSNLSISRSDLGSFTPCLIMSGSEKARKTKQIAVTSLI